MESTGRWELVTRKTNLLLEGWNSLSQFPEPLGTLCPNSLKGVGLEFESPMANDLINPAYVIKFVRELPGC